jgi:hypothetical protein
MRRYAFGRFDGGVDLKFELPYAMQAVLTGSKLHGSASKRAGTGSRRPLKPNVNFASFLSIRF